MCATVWETTPFTTNAVESKNRLSVPSSKGPGTLISNGQAEHDIIIHHRSDSQEALARRVMAKAPWRRKKAFNTSDKLGPPDTNLPEKSTESGKRPIPNQQENSRKKSKTDLLGRLVSVECMGGDKEMSSYNTIKDTLVEY
ncbi:hypothetical protein OS493_031448 [Desmophyllum pertusum]|uniref:Uncharacterized protein n=1 Tax=Desmophyllum pertusum TaxID=174260 RepID=A0A9W9ZX48_9CNID|nr:hypothetical protein OS493_031448 [Desmophyllum pertusum]